MARSRPRNRTGKWLGGTCIGICIYAVAYQVLGS